MALDLYVIYAPDGIEHFAGAWSRHVDVEGFPVCHIDDIIASKEAANRVRDRESLPRLRAFRDWLRSSRIPRPNQIFIERTLGLARQSATPGFEPNYKGAIWTSVISKCVRSC